MQLGSGGRRLYAYTVGGAVPARQGQLRGERCRVFSLPNILITLFVVATIQVVMFHYYGSTVSEGSLQNNNTTTYYDYNNTTTTIITATTTSFGGHPHLPHDDGGRVTFISLLESTVPPPPRVNLAQLRNVPSMDAHWWRTLKQELNRIAVNRLLDDNINSSTPAAQLPAADVVTAPLTTRPSCPMTPPRLKGKLHVDVNYTELPEQFSETALMAAVPLVKPGGVYAPADCIARFHVAIIIPYRDRHDHLMMLLGHLHPILQRQQLNYRIFVVEQKGNRIFNKARIMNIAFIEALKTDANYDCFVFHDVDLVPEDDRDLYSCPTEPRHMSAAVDEMGYKTPYKELVGGVLALRTEHFLKVNGYSNLYWGWGAEDDDMAYRIAHVGLRIARPPVSLARYKTIKHKKRPAAAKRYALLRTSVRRYKTDGLNSLASLNYRIISKRSLPLYTHILIDIGLATAGLLNEYTGCPTVNYQSLNAYPACINGPIYSKFGTYMHNSTT